MICNDADNNATCQTCEGCEQVYSSNCVQYEGSPITCIDGIIYPTTTSELIYEIGKDLCTLTAGVGNVAGECIEVYEEFINVNGQVQLPLTYTPELTAHILQFYRNGVLQLIDENGWFYDSGTNSIIYELGFSEQENVQVVYWVCGEIVSNNSISNVFGCTSEGAMNFDPDATIDNGTCIFPPGDQVFFDVDESRAIETKIGANLFQTFDANGLTGYIPKALELNFQTYYLTFGSQNDTQANTFNSFFSTVGADCAIYVPIQPFPFPSMHDWLVGTFNPVLIQLDQESELASKGLSNSTYISRSQQVIARYPTVQCSWDTAPIYSTATTKVERNNALRPLTDTDYGRQYEQISPDRIEFSATDQDYNLDLINQYFNNLLPGDLEAFFTTPATALPNITKQVILQWHTVDAGQQKPSDPVGNLAIGEMARFTLTNTDKFAYLFWMRMGQLVKGVNPDFDSMKRITPAFRFAYTIPVTFPYNGLDGVAVWDGVDSWGLLINNQTSTEQTILSTDISIADKAVFGNFTRNSGFADSLTSAIQNEIVSEADITVRKNSVNWITFSTASAAPLPINYIDVICNTYTLNTVTYSAGLTADLYEQDCIVNTDKPVIISLHPGGGTKTNFTIVKICKEFAYRGYLGVAADYGDTDPFTVPRQQQAICNVCNLIRYLRTNAVALGINSNNIFLMGLSAGAVTSWQTGLASKNVDANIANPLVDTYFANAVNSENPGFSSIPTASASLAGAVYSNILTYLTASDIPNFDHHGTLDCTVPYSTTQCGGSSGALESYNAMIALGINSTFVPYDGGTHGNVGSHLDEILAGGGNQVIGTADAIYSNNTFTVDIGVIRKFASLLV